MKIKSNFEKNIYFIMGMIFTIVGFLGPLCAAIFANHMDAQTYYLFGIMFGGGMALMGKYGSR